MSYLFKSCLPFLLLALTTPLFAGQSISPKPAATPQIEQAAAAPSAAPDAKEARKVARKTMFKALTAPKKKLVSDDLLLIVIVTILIPPLGVLLYEGDITNRFWISLLLTLLFYFPGLIYSLLVVLDKI